MARVLRLRCSIQPQKRNEAGEEKNEVDADYNIETYYNYCVNTISLFYLVGDFYSAFHYTAHLAVLRGDCYQLTMEYKAKGLLVLLLIFSGDHSVPDGHRHPVLQHGDLLPRPRLPQLAS